MSSNVCTKKCKAACALVSPRIYYSSVCWSFQEVVVPLKWKEMYTYDVRHCIRGIFNHANFVAASRYPFYAVQWHPEKSPFEWIDKPGMIHSTSAIRASFYTASFFVSEGLLHLLSFSETLYHLCILKFISFIQKNSSSWGKKGSELYCLGSCQYEEPVSYLSRIE